MGIYLNSARGKTLYGDETRKPYFVDKTSFLSELIPLVDSGSSYICITRPRRFGKTIVANMIAAFFNNKIDAKDIFDSLKISSDSSYASHIGSENVIHIDFSRVENGCDTYEKYISRISDILKNDLDKVYHDVTHTETTQVSDLLEAIFDETGDRFVFVLDEWDSVFHMPFIDENDAERYILFLRNLLKDQPYVKFAYMTGILPIAKYSSGSELNMFLEYAMGTEEKYSEYFGFTESEVDDLYSRYEKITPRKKLTREDLRNWYDGYHTKSGEKIYNPRSVVAALTNNNLGNYWTSSGPYDEIFFYIRHNVDGVRDDLAILVSGDRVPCQAREYAATSMQLTTRDEILSAMVVYGFLTYDNGYVMIPNHELMKQFSDMLMKEKGLGYVYQLASRSDIMLEATLHGDTDRMAEILSYIHDTETPLLAYNKEAELSAIVNLSYLSARNQYDIRREDRAGEGFVDFIFYPLVQKMPGIILELKVDATPEEAIVQIKEKKYIMRFTSMNKDVRPAQILLVGITYDKKDKLHKCKVEKLYLND